jgi:hypothetical protein
VNAPITATIRITAKGRYRINPDFDPESGSVLLELVITVITLALLVSSINGPGRGITATGKHIYHGRLMSRDGFREEKKKKPDK